MKVFLSCSRRDDPFTFVRSTSVEMFTFLMSGEEKRTTEIADLLTVDLLQKTETAEAKRARYFSNSLTHRIQLHVLQGLILVEPKTGVVRGSNFIIDSILLCLSELFF